MMLAFVISLATTASAQTDIPCDDEIYRTCPDLPNYRRFCDADGTILADNQKRTICAPAKMMKDLFTEGVDYCDNCIAGDYYTPAPVPVTLHPKTPSPISPAPITPAPITPAPVPVTMAPVTSPPVTLPPITLPPVTSEPVE